MSDTTLTPPLYPAPRSKNMSIGRRMIFVRKHRVVDSTCVKCHAPIPAVDRVARVRKSNGGQQLVQSDLCPTCRRSGRAQIGSAYRQWGSTDYTTWAEETLYPGRSYHSLSLRERQHAYWLARVRWFADGNGKFLMGYTPSAPELALGPERERLRVLRDALASDGLDVTFPPYTECLHGNDHADAGSGDTGAPQERGAADADGHAAGAEAEDFYATLARALARGV